MGIQFFKPGNYFKSKENFILFLNSANVNEIKNKENMNINKCYYIIFNKVSEEFDKNNYEDTYNLYINDIDFCKK